MGLFNKIFGTSRTVPSKWESQESLPEIMTLVTERNIKYYQKVFVDFCTVGQMDAKKKGVKFLMKSEIVDGWNQFNSNPSKETFIQWFRIAPEAKELFVMMVKMGNRNAADDQELIERNRTRENEIERDESPDLSEESDQDGTVDWPLISITQYPSMPAPFSGSLRVKGKGQIWTAGDYFAVFDVEPFNIIQVGAMMSNLPIPSSVIEYAYSVSVFYRLLRNPFGPSKRPHRCGWP